MAVSSRATIAPRLITMALAFLVNPSFLFCLGTFLPGYDSKKVLRHLLRCSCDVKMPLLQPVGSLSLGSCLICWNLLTENTSRPQMARWSFKKGSHNAGATVLQKSKITVLSIYVSFENTSSFFQ